jgi:hypothetical protein
MKFILWILTLLSTSCVSLSLDHRLHHKHELFGFHNQELVEIDGIFDRAKKKIFAEEKTKLEVQNYMRKQ